MLKNHLIVALRRLIAQPGASAVTIGGLMLGFAGCLMILGYVRAERSYDAWLPGHDRVFQVQTVIRPPGTDVVHHQGSSFPVFERMGADFPQVEAITSIQVGKTVAEHDGAPVFLDAVSVDPGFFRVFPLTFLHGSAETALSDPAAIVLGESVARQLFGTADVLGRSLTTGAGDGKVPRRIAGVLADLPPNTNLKLGVISLRDPNGVPPPMRGWGNFDQQHFVRLKAGADPATINAALPAWEWRVVPSRLEGGAMVGMASVFDFHLVPITAIHLGQAQEGAIVPGGDARALTTLTVVALLTLAMAIINFLNYGTARAIARARDVSLRRLFGASRRQIVAQFTVEALIAAAIAMLLALALVEIATPWLEALLETRLPRGYLGENGLLLPATGLLVAVGLLGGLAPALYAAKGRPAHALGANRGSAETPGSARARTALVVVQFAIAIGLIASTAVIYSQTRFIARVDPGYRRDGLIQIDNAWRFTQGSEYDAARPQMQAIPGVTGVARTSLTLNPGEQPMRLMQRDGATDHVTMGFYGVDDAFLQTMDVPLLAGRRFDVARQGDRFDGLSPAALGERGINVVINRAGARMFGLASPGAALGQVVRVAFPGWDGDGMQMVPATIVGVVENTRLRTAREPLEPLVYAYEPQQTSTVLVRYAGARPAEVMAGLERVWRRLEPEIPFEARFADDIAADFLAADRARAVLFAGFSALAVLIACLGLYGLAAFAAERRTKEIGIRKVLGATVADIVRLLAWQFTRPVVLANLVAWPATWWAMREWLNGFDIRVPLTITPFAVAGLLALAIAVATVAGHALRVARANPIHALRYE
ncbi:putative ABC transport system permease protein [Sphingomonas jejuensis]|uniref:ABC transport system permease protein n=1 Tax=Sphingomonas jejuensis TaxID=904715 RepID=A0ABX0XRD5_9SPHN|nr:ABC transporter permease [Sphingomonas jejuensis]NJC35221.1 putative ABC transport system permease protein [Sphingomonas jejuensis]